MIEPNTTGKERKKIERERGRWREGERERKGEREGGEEGKKKMSPNDILL